MSPEDLYQLVAKHGSINKAAEAIGIPAATFRYRMGRAGIGEKSNGQPLATKLRLNHDEGRADLAIQNGTVIVFSDAHFEPGVRTTCFRALLGMIKQLRPVAVINNGDAFDGGSISRYPRIGWDNKPNVAQELQAVEERLTEVEDAAKAAGTSTLVWPLGNHDARYETYLAAHAPQYEGIKGFSLKDSFPLWKPCWTCWINENVCITHFYHTGVHAVWNNMLKAHCHYVTGHRHQPEVRAYTNAMGRSIFGVDSGTLADSLGAHNRDYQQGRHGNHRSAFAVLTFKNGELLMPELVQKWEEDTVQFRGHLLNADTLAIE